MKSSQQNIKENKRSMIKLAISLSEQNKNDFDAS